MTGAPNRSGRARRCGGVVVLEALIAILVLSFATLGILGLAARALRDAGEAHWRSEAASLAASALARMWTEDPAMLIDRYDSASGGAGFRDVVAAASKLPGVTATTNAPLVTVASGASGASATVTLTLFWQPPGDALPHRYAIEQVIASR
jgi:type IV pilus assembly protein PilV